MGACLSQHNDECDLSIIKSESYWLIEFKVQPILILSIPFDILSDKFDIESIKVDSNKTFDRKLFIVSNNKSYTFFLCHNDYVFDIELKRVYIGNIYYLHNKVGKIYYDL